MFYENVYFLDKLVSIKVIGSTTCLNFAFKYLFENDLIIFSSTIVQTFLKFWYVRRAHWKIISIELFTLFIISI